MFPEYLSSPHPQSLQIGEYSAHAIHTGQFGLDGGAMFGTVPKVLWEKTNPTDDQNRIAMEARALLLKGRNRVILIDTGNGGDFVEKYGEKKGGQFARIFGIQENGPNLLTSLKRHGVEPEDVTDVIITHLHFDHSGGATRARNGKIVPTFPKATHYVQKGNWETATHPNLRERASYLAPNFEPLLEAGQLKFIEGAIPELLPGVGVELSHGHTTCQQMVKVQDKSTTLVYCADVVPTSTHARLAWVMGYDLRPLEIIEEKRKLLSQAAARNWYLFFEHDPYVDAATVQVAREGDFALKETFRIL